ncbi:hypothetical protein Agub_g6805, partial [Astrephomene gubernaculifera]
MPTMTGFRHAPVSKGLVLITAGASILAQATRASRRRQLLPGILAQAFVFRSPAELFFGALVMYYFRILERESGSPKFGAFAATTTGLAAALQWAAGRSGLLRLAAPASGPYGFLFACFVQYFFQVPPASKMSVLGWRLSDKVFLYLIGMQLLLSGGPASLLAGGAGLVAGLAYRGNLLGMKRMRFPAFLTRFLASTLGALLGSSDSSPAAAAAATPSHAQPPAAAQQQQQGGPAAGGRRGAAAGAAAAAAAGAAGAASGLATGAAGAGGAGGGGSDAL